jgi:single-stranded DNA-binding protein
MAKHNNVVLYGLVTEKPKIVKDENNEPIRCGFSLVAIRGVRDFGNNLDFAKLDTIKVMTFNKELIKNIEKIESLDMVEVKGSFVTKNVNKSFICENCDTKNVSAGTISFINPIYIGIREKVKDKDEALKLLKQKYEISNQVTLIGMLCRDPRLFKTENGINITTYQMAVMRKYKVRGELVDNTVDFPWIKTYGKLALSDVQSLSKGAYVFVEGVIQTRDVERKTICEHCGNECSWNERIEEIVPYAVEYLRNHKPKEDVSAKKIIDKYKTDIEKESDIERPVGIEKDFDINSFIDAQSQDSNEDN